MATESPTKSPKVIGGFEIIAKIGQGAMGAVFKARQVSLDRIVALKVLPPRIAQKDPVFIDRFIREARTSAKLNHLNIVQGIEVGRDEASGLYYFAMEFVDGPSLKDLIRDNRVVDERKSLEIMLAIGKALSAAHRAGIIHRDIKPDNILLSSSDEPKLADLGLARFVLDDSLDEAGPKDGTGSNDKADLTQAGQAVGTPAYMSPEQVRGKNDEIDARSDLYALGATLFHMITGKAPYSGDGAQRVMMMHLTAPVPNAHQTNPAVSEATSKLISKLMQKEPPQRIQTADHLVAQIEKILEAPALHEGRTTGKRTAVSTPHLAAQRPPKGEKREKDRDKEKGEKADKSGATTAEKKSTPTLLYAALGIVPLAIIVGMVLAGGGGGASQQAAVQKPEIQATPVGTQQEPPKPVMTVETAIKTDPRAAKPAEKTPEWEPLKKAIEAARKKPDAYEEQIQLFAAAEKGAPAEVIPLIRHERGKAERAQIKAFKALLDDRKPQAEAKANARDFAGALALLQETAFSPQLLCEYNRGELGKARSDIENRAAQEFSKTVESSLKGQLNSAGLDRAKLDAHRAFLDKAARDFPVKHALSRIEQARNALNARTAEAGASATRQQDERFRDLFEKAQELAKSGDFNQAMNTLGAVRADAALRDRFSSIADQLVKDLQSARELQQKGIEALAAKVNKDEVVSLRPSGIPLSGKIVARDESSVTIQDAQGQTRPVEFAKLDGTDLALMAGLKPDSSDARYQAAVLNFWQGKLAKANDLFVKESDRSIFYIGFMNDKAARMCNRVKELYDDNHTNSKLNDAERKARHDEAHKLMNRLKAEYTFTEAYLERFKKK